MEAKDRVIAGLDIGTTKIVAMIGRKNEHGKLEILGVGKADSFGVNRGEVTHIDSTVEAIRAAIKQAEDMAQVDITEVNVGIAGQHIKSLQHRETMVRNDKDEVITQKDIEKLTKVVYGIMMNPGEEVIHALPQEFTIDNEFGEKNPIGMIGSRLEANFHVITGHASAVKKIIRCVEQAGLKVQGLTLEPLASSEAVLSLEEKEAGVALVDIGGGTTDLAIFQDNIIRHTAVIPFGGNIITEDIRMGLNIIRKTAEQLKVRFGSALSSENLENEVVAIPGLRDRPHKEITLKNLSAIIEARMEEIIEQVYYEIRATGYEKKLFGGIVITGGGAQLRHITQLFEYITGMDVRIGYPTEHLAKGNETITNPTYSTSVGLALKGFELAERNDTHFEERKEVKAEEIAKKFGFFERILKTSKTFFEEEND